MSRQLATSALAVLVLGSSLAQCVAAAGRELIIIVAPAHFDGSWPVLGPVAFSVVAWTCYAIFTQSLLYNPKSAYLLPVVGVTGALTNCLVNALLIPRMGIVGAAWATCASNSVFALMAWRIGMHHTPVPYAWRRWLLVLVWTAMSLVAYHSFDAAAWSVPGRIGAKATWLLLSLVVTARLAGVTPSSLRALRTRAGAR